MARIGIGYDIHRLADGGALILGGVRIECGRHFVGHSDGDALLHAVTDAILGALAAGDIGEHFPDTDPAYAGADSGKLLQTAVAMAGRAGRRIGNCDVTVIAEAPKLGPHKAAIRLRVSELLGVEASAVSVKAKTNEGLGPVGAGEAIAVMAAVVLE